MILRKMNDRVAIPEIMKRRTNNDNLYDTIVR
jgi:hypothetical protein